MSYATGSPEPARPARPGSGQSARRFRHRTEFTRERDVIKHLQPWEETYSPRCLYRNAFPDTAAGSIPVPEPCPDTALAAFGQLGALRLHARHCLITLLSADAEFVLADVTRTMSLQHDAEMEKSKDQAWIGTCSFPRRDGLSSIAMPEWQTARRQRDPPAERDHYYTQGIDPHWHIINDVRHAKEYQTLRIFERGPWIRFCVSVPLRGAQGSVVGTLTLLDDKPRYGVSLIEMAFLEDLADTIVEHLDATIVRAQRQRGERLIQGLGLFINGANSLRDWWQSQDDARVLGTGRHANKGTEAERQARVDAEFGRESPSTLKLSNRRSRPALQSIVSSGSHSAKHPPASRRTDLSKAENGTAAFDLAKSLSDAYARASNLLREAMGADGVVFVNAHSVMATLQREQSGEEVDQFNEGGNSRSATWPKQANDLESSDSGPDNTTSSDILGMSTRGSSNPVEPGSDKHGLALSERALRRLIKGYSAGYSFNFDETGQSHTSSDEHSDPSSNEEATLEKTRRKLKDGKMLSKFIRGARSVALFPIWDNNNDRWRSCVFAWSTSPHRYFDGNEVLTYLAAFGNSLSAEIARLETLAANQAKSTFISSISHELRSPLHGVMAGLEFLQDTVLSPFQREMINTISMSSGTLLDTINHILDFSKISNHSSALKSEKGVIERARRDPRSPDASFSETNLTRSLDLALLTEELVETTVTAHRSQYSSFKSSAIEHNRLSDPDRTSQRRAKFAGLDASHLNEVSVYLNIEYREHWVVAIQPGAWTRIITNVLGNALKYTGEGHISIRLSYGQSPSSDLETAPVELVIQDTGIGMSDTFQSQQLFTPFKQEDPHSAGTGLGLSIVKQLAKDMGAHLDIESKQGEGTKVVVRLMAAFDRAVDTVEFPGSRDLNPAAVTVGQFHLLATDPVEESGGSFFSQDIGQSVIRLAKEWLRCDVQQGPEVAHTAGTTICAIAEELLGELQTQRPAVLSNMLSSAAKQSSQILVLGQSMRSLSLGPLEGSLATNLVFVHQPIGPRKLLRVIASGQNPISDEAGRRRSRSGLPSDAHGVSKQAPPYTLSPGELRKAKRSSQGERQARSGATPADSDLDIPDTVLLVEDNEVNMKLLHALMKKLGLKFESAVNGREAIDIYREHAHAFFLVLMDMNMPVMDGFSSTIKIREYEKKTSSKRTTIVALTGVTSSEAKARAFDCGIDEYYAKPVRMNEMKELIQRIQSS